MGYITKVIRSTLRRWVSVESDLDWGVDCATKVFEGSTRKGADKKMCAETVGRESPSELEICRLALDQIERLSLAQECGQHVMLNGARMTAAKAIGLVAAWAGKGILASELIVVGGNAALSGDSTAR